MTAEIVIAAYRPKPGQGAALLALVERHLPILREAGFVTDRPAVLMRGSADGTLLEIFEWVSHAAAGEAHHHAAVQALWTAMDEVAEFPPLCELPEAQHRFPHFTPIG